jgi:hypothetical protein
MRIFFGDKVYTLEGFNEFVQTTNNENLGQLRRIEFSVNTFLLNIYTQYFSYESSVNFSIEFTKALYKNITSMFFQVWCYFNKLHFLKIDENTMSVPYNLGIRSDDDVITFTFYNFLTDRDRRRINTGVIAFIDLQSLAHVWSKTNWNSQLYLLFKTINTTLIKLLLQKSELYQSLDSLSRSMDFKGVFVDAELRDRLEKRGRLEEFNASELSKDALIKVSQIMYKKLLTESDLVISPETMRAIPGDMPLDLVARLKREMDEGASSLT